MKKLIVFDLDGTLAESKSSLDDEMAELLDQAGFVDIEVPENQAGVHFVLGQRKRETAPTLP